MVAGSDRFWLCELRVSRHFSTFYGSSVQSMGTQLNALPALPVRARTVSGCWNSALLGLERNRPAVVTSQLLGEPASALLCSCFASESLAQTAPLSRATNLHIKANRVPPCGFVQEPVPERPQWLAVRSSSAQGPSGTGFFLFPTTRPFSAGEKLVLYNLCAGVRLPDAP
jgi:hypothetical protein